MTLSVGIIGAGPGGLPLGILLARAGFHVVRAMTYLRRKGNGYIAVRPSMPAEFVAKVDRWMTGTVWTTQCSNYFRARFKPADPAVDPDAFTAGRR